MNLDKALDRAKIGVMLNGSVFLATVTFSLKHSFNSECKTARTDGISIEYNPTFFKSLNPEQRTALIAHEAWHVALMHMTRQGKRLPDFYNYAGDYVINQLLVDDNFELPPNGLQDDKYRDMSTNQVYDILYEEAPKIDMDLLDIVFSDGSGDKEQDKEQGGNEPNNDPGKAKGSGGEGDKEEEKTKAQGKKPTPNKNTKEIEAHIKGILVKASTQSKLHNEKPGSIPGEILREIDRLINPKLPWEAILQRFLTEKVKDDYTWQRPNKRFLPDFYLPTQYSESLTHITIAIDTSGSITPEDLRAILSEIQYIRDVFKPKKMTILDCDRTIHNVYEVDEDTHILDLKFTGGGGTSCFPVIHYCKDNPTTALVYFTDLYLQKWTKEVDFPILWIVYDNPNAKVPIGEITHYKT